MEKQIVYFENVEALVDHIVKNADRPFDLAMTYHLNRNVSKAYDNAEAGEAWEAESHAIKMAEPITECREWRDAHRSDPDFDYYAALKQPFYLEWSAKAFEINERQPAQHIVVDWYLEGTSGRSRHSRHSPPRIHVSEELAEQIEVIWTHKRNWVHGVQMITDERTGRLTLEGIAKRLGKSDIGKRVKAAQESADASQAKMKRNGVRRDINSKLKDLEQFVQTHGAAIGVTSEMFALPVELSDLLQNE